VQTGRCQLTADGTTWQNSNSWLAGQVGPEETRVNTVRRGVDLIAGDVGGGQGSKRKPKPKPKPKAKLRSQTQSQNEQIYDLNLICLICLLLYDLI